MLSELEFGSYLIYSPRGQSVLSKHSKTITYAIKQDKPHPTGKSWIEFLAEKLRGNLPIELNSFLGPSTSLVPIPKSSLMQQGELWAPLRICEALVKAGLGNEVLPCLRRAKAITKSAGARERPSPTQHYETMAVEKEVISPRTGRITAVDDVVTRGATLLGAVSRLEESFPGVPIKAFALVRTISQGEIEKIFDPCVGRITATMNQVQRWP